MLIAWLVAPLVLLAVCVGCGLLLESVTGTRLSRALLPGAGLAAVIVVGQFTTLLDATAELTTPLIVSLAVAGAALQVPRARPDVSGWAAAAGLGVFAAFAAPIVLSGEATFAGYIRLDDTATWMALTDRVMEHGRSLEGLAPSTYEATLDFNLGAGYPVGVFLPLGVVQQIVGTDVAWLVQPYMAFLGALLALALWELGGQVVRDPRARALAAFLASQAALLYGYYVWGGIKEMAAAALIATAAGVIALAVRELLRRGAVLLAALIGAALIGVLSVGGAIWLVAPVAGAAWLMRREPALPAAVATYIGAAAAMSLPVFISGGITPPTSASLTDETAKGNLFEPLGLERLAGIWPAGDFRLDPVNEGAAYVLIAATVIAAGISLVYAWRQRAWAPLGYIAGTLAGGLTIFVVGSPWVGAKALATASPAIPFAAALAGAALWSRGSRAGGGLALVAVAIGVLWSSALAYRDVSLAPRDQLVELEEIGEEIAGEGPTLMTEYQPYGARHFLRDADPEAVSELRRRRIPLRSGKVVRKGFNADTDALDQAALLEYRTLVLRRSPAQSRPPLPYELAWRGGYYEVWQRADTGETPLEHLPLGTPTDPAAEPSCGRVKDLAGVAGENGELVAAAREPALEVPVSSTGHPADWERAGAINTLFPESAGALDARVAVPAPGRYEVWIGGSIRPRVDLRVDGRDAGTVRHQLQNYGQYVSLGAARLGPGSHRLEVEFHGPDAHPGSGGDPSGVGPLILSADDFASTRLFTFAPAQAEQLCGKPWDWIEAFP